METVLLKSRKGPISFTRRTRIEHDRGMTYEVRTYEFNANNDFKMAVPKEVWADLEHEWLDKTHNLRYNEALIEL